MIFQSGELLSLDQLTNCLAFIFITIHNPNFIHIVIYSQVLRIDGWKQIPYEILVLTLQGPAKVVIID